MAFINEIVSEEEIQKFDLRAINKKFHKADFDYQWTIDRDRDVYLRWIRDDHEILSENVFSFYWKGTLLEVTLKRTGDGVRGGKGYTRWSIYPRGGLTTLPLPKALEARREVVTADLKAALVAFKDFGVFSTVAEHTAYFEF